MDVNCVIVVVAILSNIKVLFDQNKPEIEEEIRKVEVEIEKRSIIDLDLLLEDLLHHRSMLKT
jgi:hypothetical protein